MKSFFPVLATALIVTFTAHSASATCIPAYQDRIKELSGKMNATRGALFTTAGGAAIATTVVIAVTGTIALGGAIGAPAAALAAAGYLTELAIERDKYRRALHLIQGAQNHIVNPELESLFKSLDQENVKYDRISVMDRISDANDQGLFCPVNERTDGPNSPFQARSRNPLPINYSFRSLF